MEGGQGKLETRKHNVCTSDGFKAAQNATPKSPPTCDDRRHHSQREQHLKARFPQSQTWKILLETEALLSFMNTAALLKV